MQQLQTLSDTVHKLQNERGFVMLYLSENTLRHKREMLGYFVKSDTSVKQLRANIEQQENNRQLDSEEQRLIQIINQNLKRLKAKRTALLSLKINASAIFDLYSYQLISPIIQLMTHLTVKIKNIHPSAVSAYCFFLQWKEKVGLERSIIIVRGFIEGNANKNQCIEHIKVLINEQKHYKESFLSLATIEQKRLINDIYKMPDVGTLHMIHQQFSTQGESDILSKMNTKSWFVLISKKINKLHDIEKQLHLTLANDHQLSKHKIKAFKASERLAYKITLFQGMATNEIEKIINHSAIYQIPRNKVFILESNPVTHLHIVLMGWVKVFKQSNAKDEILQIIGNNETVLENCLFTNQIFNASAKVITDTLMLSIPINNVSNLLKQSHKFTHNLIIMNAQKANAALQDLYSIKHKNTEQRMGEFFLKLVNDKKWKENTLQLPYNKSFIASYLGMSREVFSRNLKHLFSQSIEITGKTLSITNKEKLCKYCYFDNNNYCYNFQRDRCWPSFTQSVMINK
ncbi:nitrate- and nitrite sensing domain-containing protein [Bathymodiolus septemdierum thioautotrophic gill symbiont]|uniref:CRP/FNR family transcriptional regulator, transcriptional activator FtrB n=1 Tax=endosymbiont of Bathymodiolus septemdierum str. Myojin knoll TaxID=1303921 RepID=A0A0N7KB60_9GAMM|nr:nitrate- and nitrite sensing domain-containing protein [Bathymodiolus septemdierum thioautotrophic gill symbiont]BAS67111.1 CRP/FNR family transcriptional regulator, transcriptional activator FtrB [endosymbiont of Bathymodiolus septemdierum str. Myojin knoll]